MRFKVVPAPADLSLLEAVHGALPLVPEGVDDCCTRVLDRTDVTARDDAREWIAFLEALELAEQTPRGYERVRTDVETHRLAKAFERRVLGAEELLDALGEHGPLTVDEAFERLRPVVPEWERNRNPEWESEWHERTRRLLAWSETFGLAVRDDSQFRPVDR